MAHPLPGQIGLSSNDKVTIAFNFNSVKNLIATVCPTKVNICFSHAYFYNVGLGAFSKYVLIVRCSFPYCCQIQVVFQYLIFLFLLLGTGKIKLSPADFIAVLLRHVFVRS